MTHFKECVADLTMPKGWVDESWGNDACPSWSYKGFQVMIHHADPKEREEGFGDDPRFLISRRAEYGDICSWSAEAHTFEEDLSILNDEQTWHDVAVAFMNRHSEENEDPLSLDEWLMGRDLHAEYKAEGEAIMRLFDWHDVEEDDGNEVVVEEGEFSLQECLEDITGQMQMGKIDDSQALEIMSNIVAGHKKEQS